jgi:capsular polysaccharide biosynthesis protein
MAQNKEITLKTIGQNWRFIMVTAALFAAISFFVSTLITPQYKGEAQVLVLQKNLDMDPYRAAKSSEYTAEVLEGVAGSTDFMNGVLEKTGENRFKFGATSEKQIENWKKEISVTPIINTGIIKIAVLDPNKKEVQKLLEAILAEFQANGVKYHGNENVALKKISGPVYFENPAYPIIWLNVLVAGMIGLFVSIGYIFLTGGNIWIPFSRRNGLKFQNGSLGESFYHYPEVQ